MYNFLSKFILRTPYFYYDLLEKKDFKYLINDKIFKEAIFLASPDLYTAMINISNKSYELVTPVSKYDVNDFIYHNSIKNFNEKIKEAYCAHYFFGSWDKKISLY